MHNNAICLKVLKNATIPSSYEKTHSTSVEMEIRYTISGKTNAENLSGTLNLRLRYFKLT